MLELRPQSSLCPYRLCGWVWAGIPSPGLGDPGRPGNSRPAHWGHPVAKTTSQTPGEVSESLRVPGSQRVRAVAAGQQNASTLFLLRKAPESQEDEEERAELNQSEEAETPENGAGGP